MTDRPDVPFEPDVRPIISRLEEWSKRPLENCDSHDMAQGQWLAMAAAARMRSDCRLIEELETEARYLVAELNVLRDLLIRRSERDARYLGMRDGRTRPADIERPPWEPYDDDPPDRDMAQSQYNPPRKPSP